MLIEATEKPIRYRLQTGQEVYLHPGLPVELTDDAGRQLLRKAGGKVRLVESSTRRKDALTGQIVTWDSPLFGVLRATVHEDLPHGVWVLHPLTAVECVIPRTWLRLSPFSPFSLFLPDKS
jgi:hypothetical protein